MKNKITTKPEKKISDFFGITSFYDSKLLFEIEKTLRSKYFNSQTEGLELSCTKSQIGFYEVCYRTSDFIDQNLEGSLFDKFNELFNLFVEINYKEADTKSFSKLIMRSSLYVSENRFTISIDNNSIESYFLQKNLIRIYRNRKLGKVSIYMK